MDLRWVGIAVVVAQGVLAAEEKMAQYGTPFLEPKAYYISSESKTGGSHTRSDAISIGGRFGYLSPEFSGLSAGAILYTTSKLDPKDSAPTKNNTTILQGANKDSHHYIGQAYLSYLHENWNLKVGRQELETPLLGSNTRFLGTTYEAITLKATPHRALSLTAFYIQRANAGTSSNVLPKDSPLGLVGYGVGREVGEFVGVDKYLLGSNTPYTTDGLYALGVRYGLDEKVTLEVWDYYYADIVNSFYPEISFKTPWNKSTLFGSGSYHIQNDVGENLLGKASQKSIESTMLQLKMGLTVGSHTLTGFYADTPAHKGTLYDGLIITPFQADKYAMGYQTNASGVADTQSYRLKYDLNLQPLTHQPIHPSLALTRHEIGRNNGLFSGQSVQSDDWVFDLNYYPSKTIHVMLRYGRAYDVDQLGTDKEETRLFATARF